MMCMCVRSKRLQGQVNRSRSPSLFPLVFVSSSSLSCTWGELFHFHSRCVTILLEPPGHAAAALRINPKKVEWIRLTPESLVGHLTNTDALKGAHRMICDWTKNCRDGAGHDHRAGVICHLPEELSAQPTGKGVNSLVLKVNYIVSRTSLLLLC